MSRQPHNVTTQSLPTLMFAQITTYTDNVKFPHCNTQLYLRILLKDIEQISRSFWQMSDGDCIIVLNDKGARSSCSGTGTDVLIHTGFLTLTWETEAAGKNSLLCMYH